MLSKNVLLFVAIPTHFREMLRVARLLKTTQYNPIIFFYESYESYQQDVELCKRENIEVICINYLGKVSSKKVFTIKKKTRKIKSFLKKINVRTQCISHLFQNKLKAFVKPIFKIINFLYGFFLRKIKKIKSFLKKVNIRARWVSHIFQKKPKIFLICAKPIFKVINFLYDFFWQKFPQCLPLTTRFIRYHYIKSSDLFVNNQIKLFVLPEDNLFYNTPIFINAAKKNNIPTIIVPFTIVNVQEWAEAFYTHADARIDNIFNALLASQYPDWTYRYKDTMLILSPQYLLAFEYLQLVPSNPWLINSGYADCMAVESEFMKRYNQQAGIDANKMIITGALYDDLLAEQLNNKVIKQAELYQELGIDNNLPILLCALPPDQFGGDRADCVFSTYREMIQFWVETLVTASYTHNIIINLHPRIKPATVEFVKKFNIKISNRNIAELIPLSKIFVASCSATIRLAIACGIPVINYDVYHYRYTDYEEAKGVLMMTDQKLFMQYFKALTENMAYFEKIKSEQQSIMRSWGLLDGQCAVRMLSLIDEMIVD